MTSNPKWFEGKPSWFISAVEREVREKAPGWFVDTVLDNKQEEGMDEVVERERNRVTEPFEEQLKSMIRKKEAGRWGYDAWFGKGTSASPPKPPKQPTQMTLSEVLQWQRQTKGMAESTAVGGYQIIHNTLLDAKRKLGLTGEEVFDEELQDRIASDYLLRKKRQVSIDDFLSGKATKEQFANDLAKEWASLPVLERTSRGNVTVLPGQSYYKGVGSNKSLFKGDELSEYSGMFDTAAIDLTEDEGEA